jgi:EmrB/QacA subfamily drug resistance transporter
MKSAESASATAPRSFILALAVPFMMAILNMSMFRVAFPSMRATLGLAADVTAWLDTAYELSYLVFMPVYGRLADQLGKRRLFLIGIGIFLVGTTLIPFSPGMGLLFAGRFIQGAGTSGIHPLCIAVISDTFPPEKRGNAMGTWNSFGTVAAMTGPLVGGLLIDALHWRAILIPVFVVGVAALAIVTRTLPREPVKPGSFDGLGLFLFGGFLSLVVFWVSSRPITGAPPLTDWRLLVGALLLLVLFVIRELRASSPLISLSILRYRGFTAASICSGMRMFLFGGFGILLPLYLAEIGGMSSSLIGLILTGHYVFLLLTMRIGGLAADRIGSRWLSAAGALSQALVMVFLGFPGPARSEPAILLALVVHGLGAGVYLAPLHRAAMASIPRGSSGAAAGLYSVLRYSGSLMGPAVAGVLLQTGLSRAGGVPVRAYQGALLIVGLIGLLGTVSALSIREAPAA